MTDDRLNETLKRLRRRFGIPEPPDTQERAAPPTPAHAPARGVWPLDSIRDTAAALAARHRIDRARYRDSAWYRRQVDAQSPAYARALAREQPAAPAYPPARAASQPAPGEGGENATPAAASGEEPTP